MLRQILKNKKVSIPVGIIIALAIAVGGTILYVRASTPGGRLEPEQAALNGAASIGCSTAVSNGQFIQFGGTNTSPCSTGGGGGGGTTGFFVRGMYENSDGTHTDLFKSLGFNTINIGASKSSLDTLASKNMKGMVWLGDYSTSCSFELSDDTIRSTVGAIKGHSAIQAYFLADEPEQQLENCPNVGAQMKARSDLVKSIDPSKPTYIVVSHDAFVAGHTIECYPYHYFANSADIIGLDIYPYRKNAGSPCDQAVASNPILDVDKAITAAESQGVKRYYAILQDFEDSIWRRPVIDPTKNINEIADQFNHWDASHMEGYFIFSWDWSGNSLDGNTTHQNEFKTQNARTF
jgi:hypothetical protein